MALVALVALAARRRHKETRYGAAFSPAVHFRARSSYGRRSAQATLSRLGISPELKEKLRDVLVERHRLALGKTLGQGEFGSVVEGTLHQDSGVLRVAVKTMKLAACSRGELEDFLSEAVCMKEFDHPNVMKLIGAVPPHPAGFHGRHRGRDELPEPQELRAPRPGRQELHRVGRSLYYRQGRGAPVPVKWVALESLAERVYTTKSDVVRPQKHQNSPQKWTRGDLKPQKAKIL
ncbi:tyrosine-protein kinase receptor UFO-like [Passerculus sandwichensis]